MEKEWEQPDSDSLSQRWTVLNRLDTLPAEVLLAIFRSFFDGIRLTPIPGNRHKCCTVENRDNSRLALLLMSKSHTQMVQTVLWECATVLIACPVSLCVLQSGTYPLDRVQEFELDMTSRHDRPTFLLISRVIRRLPKLRLIRFVTRGPVLNFSRWSLLAEIHDGTSELTRAVRKHLSTRYSVIDLLNEAWLTKLVTDASDANHVLEVEIKFSLRSEQLGPGNASNCVLLTGPVGALELFNVPVVFSAKKQTLTGVHKDTAFSVPQQPLVPKEPHFHRADIYADNSQAESELWRIVDERFSNMKLTPRSTWQLHNLMNDNPELLRAGVAPVESMEASRDRELAWNIGKILYAVETHALDDSCEECSDQFIDDVEFSPTDQYNIWRRVLQARSQPLRQRPWRVAYDLVAAVENNAEEPGYMMYEQQETFFTRLFDPKQKWVTDK
ncbi:uncharacterized protein AB675_9849 [Cyphellophora attinorum]|uniref:Uncharacterized protein n=1 Tax=Cyphellophora attinorum TaxID=1664694 RepID=A0A0N1HTK2_9EURO|nr:uncharacterized protein AB675_9849 [Phialophora attinorum]KPI42385.1 hypothetical protein AB675_9849 [Phialophora attinorum]